MKQKFKKHINCFKDSGGRTCPTKPGSSIFLRVFEPFLIIDRTIVKLIMFYEVIACPEHAKQHFLHFRSLAFNLTSCRVERVLNPLVTDINWLFVLVNLPLDVSSQLHYVICQTACKHVVVTYSRSVFV